MSDGNLFDTVDKQLNRAADAMGLDAIVAEPLPEHDLGMAINDRLRRAAAK